MVIVTILKVWTDKSEREENGSTAQLDWFAAALPLCVQEPVLAAHNQLVYEAVIYALAEGRVRWDLAGQSNSTGWLQSRTSVAPRAT